MKMNFSKDELAMVYQYAAGIATAVPNPAIASSKPPNPHVNSNT